jgi:hypothetical protein
VARLPGREKDKVDARVVQVNDGRHIHMLAFNPPVSRMKEDFADHIDENQKHYARSPLFRIHVEPVTETPGKCSGIHREVSPARSGRFSLKRGRRHHPSPRHKRDAELLSSAQFSFLLRAGQHELATAGIPEVSNRAMELNCLTEILRK